jgi:uncharacterized protein YbjT (DUF2867 family)
MKILILGATGRTGQLLVDEALKNSYDVNVLLRAGGKINNKSEAFTIFQGTPIDEKALRAAMNGCEAVLSTLNISRTSDFPWAPLRTPKNFLSLVMTNLIELARELQIKRIIVTTAWGVNETKKDLPYWFRWLIDYSNIGYAYRDHELQEELLEKSNLSWTIVRPVGLTNSTKEKQVLVSINNSPKPQLTISRQSVAKFMISALYNELYFKQSPTISEK